MTSSQAVPVPASTAAGLQRPPRRAQRAPDPYLGADWQAIALAAQREAEILRCRAERAERERLLMAYALLGEDAELARRCAEALATA